MIRTVGFIKFRDLSGTRDVVPGLRSGHSIRDDEAMTRVTRDDVIRAIGVADDVTIAQIIGTEATVEELAEAQAWIANDEPLMNAGRPLATGRVRELVDILSELQPEDEEEVGPAAVTQE